MVLAYALYVKMIQGVYEPYFGRMSFFKICLEGGAKYVEDHKKFSFLVLYSYIPKFDEGWKYKELPFLYFLGNLGKNECYYV